MELLQVETLAVTRSCRIATVEPHSLADLVADRLTGHAQVAVDLRGHEVAWKPRSFDDERERELRRPHLARVVCLVDGNAQFEVHADVDDDSHGAHRLTAELAQLVERVVEVAELLHQPLCIQRPPLDVPRCRARQSLEARERVGLVAHLGDLQMVSGDALVVADRHLSPQRETGLAERRVPRTARPAEVLARTGVVHRRRTTWRCDHRLATPDRIGDVEVDAVHGCDGVVDELLVPPLELVDAVDAVSRIVLHVVEHLVQRAVGQDQLADLGHPRLDASQFAPPPCVGLLEVEHAAVHHGRPRLIPLSPDRIVRRRAHCVRATQPVAHLAICGCRCCCLCGRHPTGAAPTERCPEARVGMAPGRALLGAGDRLSSRRHCTVVDPHLQHLAEPGECIGDASKTLTCRRPILGRVERHQVERRPGLRER